MAKLPTVVSSVPQDVKAFINQVRQALDGRNGDRLLSVNDLVSSGVVVPGPGNTVLPPPGLVGAPATPRNVQASGAIQNIIVTWDDPLYNGHSHAEVWGSSTDDLGAAVKVGMTPGAIFVDAVGPSVTRYYWVRFVNVLGVVGAFNAVAGVQGVTGSDVAYLLDTLTGQITESQLYNDLNDRIDNIEVNTAAITTEATTRASADTALSSQITTVSAATTTNTAAIQTEVTTRASETGSLFAKYTVKVDVNGYVSGFGLASTANNATPFSEFAIRADRFYVASPSGPGLTPIIPFIVNTTTQTVNGVSVPAGIYMDAAFVKNGTITTAKIGNAQIDDAKIVSLTAAKITAGDISVGNYIQSSGFISGSQGWRIHGNGVAEFAAASIRGQLVAAQINTNGLSIRDTSGNVILNAGTGDFTGSVAGTAGSTLVNTANTALSTANSASSAASTAQGTADFAVGELTTKLDNDARNVLSGPGGLATGTLNWNSSGVRTSGSGVGLTANGLVAYNSAGAATFVLNGSNGNASFAGTLSAATGSFAGSLSAATGTFSGTLTASAIDAVDTINIAGSAVTVPQVNSTSGHQTSVNVNFSDTESTKVLMWGVCSGVVLVSGGCYIRLFVDGAPIKETFSNSAGGIIPTITLPIITYTTLTPGPHTLICNVSTAGGSPAPAVETTIVVMGAKR